MIKVTKIKGRKNLLYPLMSLVFYTARQIIMFIFDKFLNFGKDKETKETLILIIIMFFAEFFSGLFLYFYQIGLLSDKKGEEKKKVVGIKLIYKPKILIRNNYCKIAFLIFVAAFFDFNEFIIATYYMAINASPFYLDISLRSLLTIFCAFSCYFILNMRIYRHQKVSLWVISICLIIVIIINVLFYPFNYEEVNLQSILIIFIGYFFNSHIEVIEKSLMEYNYINPFVLLFL